MNLYIQLPILRPYGTNSLKVIDYNVFIMQIQNEVPRCMQGSFPEMLSFRDYVPTGLISLVYHRRKIFSEEHIELLKDFGVDYNVKFPFEPVNVFYTVPDGT